MSPVRGRAILRAPAIAPPLPFMPPMPDTLPSPIDTLSAAEARRTALAAQGFDRSLRSAGRIDARHLKRLFDRVALVQIDSVNVLSRAHYLPGFARLGPYPTDLVERAAWGRRSERTLFEYWGHEASLIPVEHQPLLRWRMARAARGEGIYGGLARFGRERADFVASVLAEVRARGPLGASELSEGGRGQGAWWGWSDGKQALEWLFWAGRVTTATRRNFERLYDLPERVLPPRIVEAPTPDEADAQRALVRLAARAMGVATEIDFRTYWRLPPADAGARIAELAEAGELVPVSVEGWDRPAWLDPAARVPGRLSARALIGPFDSLVWERPRTERLFDFHYRLEIYTPAAQRRYGYYVLPFLLGDRLVGRLDLKADRASSVLRVHAAHGEPRIGRGRIAPARVAEAMATELRRLADWLGLEQLSIGDGGDLAGPLKRVVHT